MRLLKLYAPGLIIVAATMLALLGLLSPMFGVVLAVVLVVSAVIHTIEVARDRRPRT